MPRGQDLRAYGVDVTVKGSADQWMSFEWKDALKDAQALIPVVSQDLISSSAAFQLLRVAEADPTAEVRPPLSLSRRPIYGSDPRPLLPRPARRS